MISCQKIAQWCNATVLQEAPHRLITELCIDSRKIIYPEESIFIALKTARRDGQKFIEEVYNKGVRSFLLHEPIDIAHLPAANVLVVPDTLQALQQIAACHRKLFNIPVLGITGSNGKTVVKEWLYHLLSADKRIVRNPKSYNSQIGVALSVWKMETLHELAIFEAGISQPDEMTALEKMIKPTHGLFVNIGAAHSEGFISQKQKIVEKLKLFTHCHELFYCKDYNEINEVIVHSQRNSPNRKLISWSTKQEADLYIMDATTINGNTTLKGIYRQEEKTIEIPFTDPASIENATHCWLYLLYHGMEDAVIAERMKQLHAVAMRLEMKQGINGSSIINDTYNSDLTSLSIALDFLKQQKQHPRHTVILSDLLQTGKPDAVLYEEVAELIQQSGVNKLVGVGTALYRYQEMFAHLPQLKSSFYKSTDELLDKIHTYQPGNEAILLKGARSFHFERISKLLEEKIHQTVFTIDMAALVHNLNVYKHLLKPSVKMMVMVKAFSYGSGTFEIGHALQYAGVDYLAVAYTDEGVALRRAGITLPIMVMSPEQNSYERMMAWRLEPELYNKASLEHFIKSAEKQKASAYPVHIKLDTGMHRLGFEENELKEMLSMLMGSDAVTVKSLFSHLAASEDTSMNYFTTEQRERFERMTTFLIAQLGYAPLRHLSNSAAIAAHPELQYDMVRLGIGLHGIDNSNKLKDKLQNVGTLKTTIAQIKEIAAGETIGYGRKGTVDKPSRIATISIGYADGYPRSLSKGVGKVLVRGRLVPIVGVVCMDMCMVDVTDVPQVQVGDEVILFGKDLPLTQVAAWADTIPYEIMTGISQRVKRVYENEV